MNSAWPKPYKKLKPRCKRAKFAMPQLRSALEYAKSDAFTERYAREQAHYAKAGEVLCPAVRPVRTLLAERVPWWQTFVTVDITPTGQISEPQSIADNKR